MYTWFLRMGSYTCVKVKVAVLGADGDVCVDALWVCVCVCVCVCVWQREREREREWEEMGEVGRGWVGQRECVAKTEKNSLPFNQEASFLFC